MRGSSFSFLLIIQIMLGLVLSSGACKAKFRSVMSDGTKQGAIDGAEDGNDADATADDGNGDGDGDANDDRKLVFTANGSPGILTINPGDNVELEWKAEGYTDCKLTPLNLTGLDGKHDLGPVTSDQTHTLKCDSDKGETTKTVEIRMAVTPVGPMADLKVNGQDGPVSVPYGSDLTLTWTSKDATTCVLTPDNISALSGTRYVSNVTASVVYTLTCTSSQGTTADTVSVNVETPGAPTADFRINGSKGPLYVDPGSNLKIVWSSNNATSCNVNPANFTGLSGDKTITNVTTSGTYSLFCQGPGGTIAIDISVYMNNQVVGSLDLKVNGQDGIVTVPYNSTINLTWTSQNASSCEVITPSQKFTGLTGSAAINNVTLSQSILMICTYNGGAPQYDYVTVSVNGAPAPTADLKANGKDDLLVINKGQDIVLAWTSTNASDCTVTPGNYSGTSRAVSIQNVSQTTAFTLTCSGPGGNMVDAVVVHVNTDGTNGGKMPTVDLKVNNSDGPIEVPKGSNVTVTWTSSDADQCSVAPGNKTGTSGSYVINNVTKETVVVLVCVGPGGSNTDMVTVRTQTDNTDPNAKKPSADLKVNGSDGPIKVNKGDNVNVTWWSSDADQCVLVPNFITGTSASYTLNNLQRTTIFILYCSGKGGTFVDQVTVNVDVGNLAPVADLKINNSDGPIDITLGQGINIAWSSTYATSCTLYPNGISSTQGVINNAMPQQSIAYVLRCIGVGGVSYDTVVVNVHKPTVVKELCTIYIMTNRTYGCGPNKYEYWWLWITNNPPVLYNNVQPSQALTQTTTDYGVWGRWDVNQCAKGFEKPMPQTYTKNGYTYQLWTNGVAGSADCRVFTGNVSPLIISFTTERIQLTSPNEGPLFDLTNDGTNTKSRYSWPIDGNSHMFLVYDKNGNRQIDSVDEMFGNNTIGPDGKKAANGFETLKKFDANRDGMITAADPIFHRLELWADKAPYGTVQPGELIPLSAKNIRNINLDYKNGSIRLDFYGNESKESSTVGTPSGRSYPIVDYWFVPGDTK